MKKKKLKALPTAKFYFVSDNAHFFAAYALSLTSFYLFSIRVGLVFSALIAVYAGIKEFYYDNHYECAEERGSNMRDFLGYVCGLLLVFVFVFFKTKGSIVP